MFMKIEGIKNHTKECKNCGIRYPNKDSICPACGGKPIEPYKKSKKR